MTTLLTSIVAVAVMALSAVSTPSGPIFRCHPAGGSCVAVEPGQASPYPPTRSRRRAWVFFHRLNDERAYSAFTDARSCEAARDFTDKPSRCSELSAATVLQRVR